MGSTELKLIRAEYRACGLNISEFHFTDIDYGLEFSRNAHAIDIYFRNSTILNVHICKILNFRYLTAQESRYFFQKFSRISI